MTATTYAARIAGIPMPGRIRNLPVHPQLRLPVPWFCSQDPLDFRVIRPGGFATAHKRGLCWICGGTRYPKRQAFAVGPMCVVTGTSSEPPSHPECARFAVQACPFLANPRMRRNTKDLPADTQESAGFSIDRNPGVGAILITDGYQLFGDGRGGVLVQMGPPLEVQWWREGRPATRAEVAESIDTGLPALRPLAEMDGPEGVAELEQRLAAAQRWMPAA